MAKKQRAAVRSGKGIAASLAVLLVMIVGMAALYFFGVTVPKKASEADIDAPKIEIPQ